MTLYASSKHVFTVSPKVIWFSSLFMGVLASVPKILRLQVAAVEVVVDSSVAFLFSLFVWYYNIYSLPKYTSQPVTNGFFSQRLAVSLLLGMVLMLFLVSMHQLLFPHYRFQPMILMYEFRGVLINLTIYMFLHLLYQSHRTQLIGIELERTKADNLGAQYELLKQQVNPHFLFNSLNTLKSMIEMRDGHAADFVVKLADFYRFTLESRKHNVIPLAEELEILKAYMFLLQARFEEGISLSCSISEAHHRTYIPPFTLQLLVENCIKHNVVSLEQPLQIQVCSQGDKLLIQNRLQRKNNPDASIGMGLENINHRYLHLLHKKIEVEENDVVFKVKLPVIYEYPDH